MWRTVELRERASTLYISAACTTSFDPTPGRCPTHLITKEEDPRALRLPCTRGSAHRYTSCSCTATSPSAPNFNFNQFQLLTRGNLLPLTTLRSDMRPSTPATSPTATPRQLQLQLQPTCGNPPSLTTLRSDMRPSTRVSAATSGGRQKSTTWQHHPISPCSGC